MIAQRELKKKTHQRQLLVSNLVKSASQLRGLTFGTRLDLELLRGGLAPYTFTFLYGKNANQMMNVLCSNSLRFFGGRAMFIDAANCFDPYFIVQECAPSKGESDARKFIESIIVTRAFTCYQLRKLVTKQISDEIEKNSSRIKAIFVTGISSVFNEQDNTALETERLQFLIATELKKIASNRENGVLFVVASSEERCPSFVSKSDTAIKFFVEQKTKQKARNGDIIEKAILMKHYTRQFATAEL